MTALGSTFKPMVVAVSLFLACVGVLLALANTPPPKTPVQPTTTSEDLEGPREIQGVPCTGYASFGPDGRLAGCILSREHAFGPLLLPANTQIRRFYEEGTPKDVHLGQDTVLDGHRCLGRGPGEWMAGFHPNGRLAFCFLVDSETIDGVPCTRGSFWGDLTGGVIVRFHDNGRLATCRLAADVTLAGQVVKKGKRIALDPEGNVVPPGKTAK